MYPAQSWRMVWHDRPKSPRAWLTARGPENGGG